MGDMSADTRSADQPIQHEPEEACPPLVALGVGIQGVMLVLATLVLIVAVTARAGGQGDGYATWAVLAALIIAGSLTALQAGRFWRLGSGHLLIMGPTPNYVAVSVLALNAGGRDTAQAAAAPRIVGAPPEVPRAGRGDSASPGNSPTEPGDLTSDREDDEYRSHRAWGSAILE